MTEEVDAAAEIMSQAALGANEYGEWASQLHGGWGDADDVRRMFTHALNALLEGQYVLLRDQPVGWWNWFDGDLTKSGSFRYDHHDQGVNVRVFREDPP